MLNTIIVQGDITSTPYGCSPTGHVLDAGTKLTVAAGMDGLLKVTNVGKELRPAASGDVMTIVPAGESESFGPYVGVRYFWFGVLSGRGSYTVTRDE